MNCECPQGRKSTIYYNYFIHLTRGNSKRWGKGIFKFSLILVNNFTYLFYAFNFYGHYQAFLGIYQQVC